MIVMHDHPCLPIRVPRGPLGTSFTYDCRCGKLMIVKSCKLTDTVVWGEHFTMTLPDGTKVEPNYIEL